MIKIVLFVVELFLLLFLLLIDVAVIPVSFDYIKDGDMAGLVISIILFLGLTFVIVKLTKRFFITKKKVQVINKVTEKTLHGDSVVEQNAIVEKSKANSGKVSTYLIIDVETPNVNNDRISSIGAFLYDNNGVIKDISSLINPEARFDERNIGITGLNYDLVKNSPTFEKYWNKNNSSFNNVIVGHNITFDLGVICKTLALYEIDVPTFKYIDTLEIARQNLKELDNYKLPTVCKALGCDILNHHDSRDDAIMTLNILEKMIALGFDFKPKEFEYKEDEYTIAKNRVSLLEYRQNKEQILKFDNEIEVTIRDNVFVFTGDFAINERTYYENYVAERGGIVGKSVTKKTNYVIVGRKGSDKWAYGNFGTKINAALKNRDAGQKIYIISEEHFIESI